MLAQRMEPLRYDEGQFSKRAGYPEKSERITCFTINATKYILCARKTLYLYFYEKIDKRESNVTVCVAAICDNASVFGASDRMLTSGDVKFEPPQEKIYSISSSIAVMIAGDASLQLQLVQQLQSDAVKLIEQNPQAWLPVREVALIYHNLYKQEQKRRAHTALLTPLGLDETSFITLQQQMAPSLVKQLTSEIVSFDMPDIETIIAGVDLTGPHIYTANNRGISCHDGAGFAAIGVGYWHANSQFMFAEHARTKPMAQTLLLTYAAKRRAEVAPGVGEATDMFMIGPRLGTYFTIGEHVLVNLKKIYVRTRQRAIKSQQVANKEVVIYVEELNEASTTKEQSDVSENSGASPEIIERTQPSGAASASREARKAEKPLQDTSVQT